MSIRNTYWIVSLSVILTFSLVLPLCAHANMQESKPHQNQDRTHAAHSHAAECTCGHQLAEAFQKVGNKPLQRSHQPVVAVFTSDVTFATVSHIQLGKFSLSTSFDDTGPPLFLLNSVFLN